MIFHSTVKNLIFFIPQVPNNALELAKMAIYRITSVDRLTEITVYDAKEIEESLDKTWIVSGQSPDQKEMITRLAKDKALYVEGGFRVWLREAQVIFFYKIFFKSQRNFEIF
jgi:signaling intermediate in Toll pathway protein